MTDRRRAARATTGARRRTTLAEVATRAGVSPTTASLVLNGRPIRVPDETRERVRAAASDLHYVPNALVRSLQAGRTGTLGVYVEFRASVWHNAFVGALVDGLRHGAAAAAADVLLYRPPPVAAGAPAAVAPADAIGPAIVMDGRADAAVLWLAASTADAPRAAGTANMAPTAAGAPPSVDASLRALARQRFPTVVLMHDAVPAPLASVVVDERHGSALVLDHLRALGHRTIAYYAAGASQLAPHLRLRRDAFLVAAVDAGVPVAPHLVLAGPVAQTVEPVLDAVAHHAAGSPTAIVCAFEELAYRTLAAAERAGLRVPQDVSIAAWEVGPPLQPLTPAGGGDGPAGSAPVQSPFTGVHVPIWEIGHAAADLALALSRGAPRPDRRLRFSPSLQVARSTGLTP